MKVESSLLSLLLNIVNISDTRGTHALVIKNILKKHPHSSCGPDFQVHHPRLSCLNCQHTQDSSTSHILPYTHTLSLSPLWSSYLDLCNQILLSQSVEYHWANKRYGDNNHSAIDLFILYQIKWQKDLHLFPNALQWKGLRSGFSTPVDLPHCQSWHHLTAHLH